MPLWEAIPAAKHSPAILWVGACGERDRQLAGAPGDPPVARCDVCPPGEPTRPPLCPPASSRCSDGPSPPVSEMTSGGGVSHHEVLPVHGFRNGWVAHTKVHTWQMGCCGTSIVRWVCRSRVHVHAVLRVRCQQEEDGGASLHIRLLESPCVQATHPLLPAMVTGRDDSQYQ